MVSPLFGPYGKLSPGDGALIRDAGGNAAFFHDFDPELFDLCHRDDLAPCVEFKTFRVNFDQYPVSRMSEYPREVNIAFMKTDKWLYGVGEEAIPQANRR